MNIERILKVAKSILVAGFTLSVCLTLARYNYTASLFSDTARISSNVLRAGVWADPQQAAKDIREALEDNPKQLFSLLSDDLQQTFDQEQFQKMVEDSGKTIIKVEETSFPKSLNDEWSEFTLKITLQDGTVQEFLVVLHKESGGWKIFGTKSL